MHQVYFTDGNTDRPLMDGIWYLKTNSMMFLLLVEIVAIAMLMSLSMATK